MRRLNYAAQKTLDGALRPVHCRGKSPIINLTSSLATVRAVAVQSSSWYVRNPLGVCLQPVRSQPSRLNLVELGEHMN